MTVEERIAAVAAVAADWQDPDHPPRAEAVQATLEVRGRYTEEGLAFALNHRMHQLSEAALRNWIGEGGAPAPLTVAVSSASAAPLAGLEAMLAAVLVGHHTAVAAEDVTPLVTAFADALSPALRGNVRFVPRAELLADPGSESGASADAWIATPIGEEEDDLTRLAEAAGIDESRRWVGRVGVVVAIVGGDEDRAAWSGLAEDLLLHDGQSEASPRIVWAPTGTSPDALLDALAGFRELFPPHPDTGGTLSLPTAFLEAAGRSHATGPGFLVSLGEPEPQSPAHVRWSEYADLADVWRWLEEQETDVLRVVATSEVAERLGAPNPTVPPGDAHRPALDRSLAAFLRAL